MEQLDQLKTMRDQAEVRLEAARAAIEKSPDAKLVSSLGSLIADLEDALGIAGDGAKDDQSSASAFEAKTAEPVVEKASKDKSATKSGASEDDSKSKDAAADMTLEESLEAELMGE